jgi:hypothetical protein
LRNSNGTFLAPRYISEWLLVACSLPSRIDPERMPGRLIEVGHRRAPGLDQRGVQVVVEQVQPQDIGWLRDLPHRREIRRDDFGVLSACLLRKRPHAADRIVLEVGNFGRHEAADPSFGSHGVGEDAGPIAVRN